MNSIFAMNTDSIVQFLVALLMLAIVIVLCYFTTKFIASYQKGVIGKGNIEVLEGKNLGSNKSLQIVRIGEEYYVLGVSKDNISLISKIDKETLHYEKQEPVKLGESFGKILEKVKKNKTEEK